MIGLVDELARLYRTDDDLIQRHQEAMACGELEAYVNLGILLFDDARRRHKAWFAAVESDQQPYDIEEAQRFASRFRDWQQATARYLSAIDELSERGFVVEQADELRRRYQELDVVDLDVQEKTARYARLDQGDGLTLDEFFGGPSPANQP